MENVGSPPLMGKRIYNLLEKNKILLLQDKIFPSVVTGIVGESMNSSWWSHPLANQVYNGLQWLEENRPVLSIKLINGKVTYLHESLFADFYSVVSEPRDWQLKQLKEDDQKLLKYVLKNKKVVSEDRHSAKVRKDSKKSFATLEKRLLIHSREVHTRSGKHLKEYMGWDQSMISTAKPSDYLSSKSRIEAIVGNLCNLSGAAVKLPWRTIASIK